VSLNGSAGASPSLSSPTRRKIGRVRLLPNRFQYPLHTHANWVIVRMVTLESLPRPGARLANLRHHARNPFFRGRRPFFSGHYSLLRGRHPFLRGHHPFLRGHHPFQSVAYSVQSVANPFGSVVNSFQSVANSFVSVVNSFASVAYSFLSVAYPFLSVAYSFASVAYPFLSVANLFASVACSFQSLDNPFRSVDDFSVAGANAIRPYGRCDFKTIPCPRSNIPGMDTGSLPANGILPVMASAAAAWDASHGE
jgi:hypothetical protein